MKKRSDDNLEQELGGFDRLISEPAARKALGGLSARTMRRYRTEGLLPYVRIGGLIRYRIGDIEEFIRDRETRATRRDYSRDNFPR